MRPLRTDERYAIVGATGSGKSWFAERLARALALQVPVIFVDSKNDGKAGKKTTIAKLRKQLRSRFSPLKPGIYRVDFHSDLPDAEEVWNAFCGDVLQKGNLCIWVDEAYMVPDVPNFRRLYTAGRSRNVSMLTCAQRPVSIPRVCVSEATRYFIFQLHDKRDRDTVSAFVPEPAGNIARRMFAYYDTETGEFIPALRTA